jgi:hypothetical protein
MFESRLLQRRLTSASTMFALVLIAASHVAAMGNVRAGEECIAKPNAPAPQGQHWYYRTDRASNRQCWYLRPEDASVQKRATEATKQALSEPLRLTAAPAPAPARTQRPTAATAVTPVEPDISAPATPPPWPEAVKSLDVPASFEAAPKSTLAEWPQSADVIDRAPVPMSNPREEPQSSANARRSPAAAPARAAGEADHMLALVTIALVALAIAGPVYHVATWRRWRRAGGQQSLGWDRPSTQNIAYPRAGMSLLSGSETAARHISPPPESSFDQTEELTQALQQLLNEMQTKQSASRPEPSNEAVTRFAGKNVRAIA